MPQLPIQGRPWAANGDFDDDTAGLNNNGEFDYGESTPEATPKWSKLHPRCDQSEQVLRHFDKCIVTKETRDQCFDQLMSPECVLEDSWNGITYVGRDAILSHFKEYYQSLKHIYCHNVEAVIPGNIDGTELTVFKTVCAIQTEPFYPRLPVHAPFLLSLHLKLSLTRNCNSIKYGLAFDRAHLNVRYAGPANGGVPRIPQMKRALTDDDVWTRATSPSGCRAVQQAFDDIANATSRDALVRSLKGHVVEAAMSPYANHVLSKCIKVVEPEKLQFIVDELLAGQVCTVAQNKYGCRVLERVIDRFPRSQLSGLIGEILNQSSELCRHNFGNFVMQHIVRYGSPEDRDSVVATLQADALKFAKHRMANHVMLRVIEHCSAEDRSRLLKELQPAYQELAHHQYGSFIAREIRRFLPRHGGY